MTHRVVGLWAGASCVHDQQAEHAAKQPTAGALAGKLDSLEREHFVDQALILGLGKRLERGRHCNRNGRIDDGHAVGVAKAQNILNEALKWPLDRDACTREPVLPKSPTTEPARQSPSRRSGRYRDAPSLAPATPRRPSRSGR